MGKKINTTKLVPLANSAEASAPAPATTLRKRASAALQAIKAVATRTPRAIRPALAKPPVELVKPVAASKAIKPPTTRLAESDVALRAYFIAEKRMAEGRPGDSHQDWIEAERQLAVEANGTGAKKARKRN